MYLVRTMPSGAEEWRCTVCDRRFLMRWIPKYSRLVLNQGDMYAIHSGVKDNMLKLGEAALNPPLASSDWSDERLAPWRKWLDECQL